MSRSGGGKPATRRGRRHRVRAAAGLLVVVGAGALGSAIVRELPGATAEPRPPVAPSPDSSVVDSALLAAILTAKASIPAIPWTDWLAWGAGVWAPERAVEVRRPESQASDADPLQEREVERVPKPEAVRGIYVGAWSVGSQRRLGQLIRLADETEINAFVIDVKDATGEVSYATGVPLAKEIGATRRVKIPDVREVLARLKAHGIYPIARIVVFKDPVVAAGKPEWAIAREDGSVWEDQHGVRWVDAFDRHVWDYNIDLAREALALGFSEVQWDYVRFPDVPSSYLVTAVYPAQAGREKTEAIREFLAYSRERLSDFHLPITADVFGITTSAHRDYGIGQVWERMADVTDVLLPMVYPSHYPRGSWNFDRPNAAPYQVVRRALQAGIERTRAIEGAAEIRPWLQAFTLGEPPYGPRQIRAQIDAVYDSGLHEWILWHAGVRYPREAFADADGNEPWFAGLGAQLFTPADSLPAPAEARSGGGR